MEDAALLVKQIIIQAVWNAQASGVVTPLVGVSAEALARLTDGQFNNPFPLFSAAITHPCGKVEQMNVHLFCDPGLRGVSAYAIQWPVVPVSQPTALEEGD